jgi:hypothetical protein
LAQAAAELALLGGDADRACVLGDGLATGRGDIYWLRLRAYCQARKGQMDAAQLTLDLAQGQARDPVFGRLMAARLGVAKAGPKPGPASLRNGLDVALSKDLGLDLSAATPAPAVAAALNPSPMGPPRWVVDPAGGAVRATLAAAAGGDLATARTMRASLSDADTAAAGAYDLALLDAVLAAEGGRGADLALDRLIERGGAEGPKTRARAQVAALLLASLGAPMSDAARGAFAGFAAGETKTPPALALTLREAGAAKRPGEAAALALWIAAEAGPAGPASGDRARIAQALSAAGLQAEARTFVVEGLLALR